MSFNSCDENLSSFNKFLSAYTPSLVKTISIFFSSFKVATGKAWTCDPIKAIGYDILLIFKK